MAKDFYKYKLKLKLKDTKRGPINLIVPCINMRDVRIKKSMIIKIFQEWPYDFELLDHNSVFIRKLSD